MSNGYDERCWELAGHFLGGQPPEIDDRTHRDDLAQAIQDAVENWFAGLPEGRWATLERDSGA